MVASAARRAEDGIGRKAAAHQVLTESAMFLKRRARGPKKVIRYWKETGQRLFNQKGPPVQSYKVNQKCNDFGGRAACLAIGELAPGKFI